jgi:hypothetical protein
MGGIGAIEVAGGLVGEEELGPAGEGPGDGGALEFSAAELMGKMAPVPGQANKIDHFGHPGADSPGGFSAQEQGELDVFGYRHSRQEVKELENDADMVPTVVGQGRVICAMEGQITYPELSRIGHIQPAQQV